MAIELLFGMIIAALAGTVDLRSSGLFPVPMKLP